MHIPTVVDQNGIEWTPFEKELVFFIDNLLEMHKKRGSPTQVSSESDWDTLSYIIKGFTVLYPQLAKDFFDNMTRWRQLSASHGVSREGEARVQHQLEVPEKIHGMIKIVYPDQKWDKKFVAKFARRFSSFMGTDKL